MRSKVRRPVRGSSTGTRSGTLAAVRMRASQVWSGTRMSSFSGQWVRACGSGQTTAARVNPASVSRCRAWTSRPLP